MTPAPRRDTWAGQVYNDLRNLARRDGRDHAEYLTLYALEGFLTRLAASTAAEDFVLKGGVLMAAFAARRPTRDIDLAATGFKNDIPEVVGRVRAIIALHSEDGLAFDLKSVSGEAIRDDADYTGVRVKIAAQLATARIALHVDVNFGDPIWPAPAEQALPLLLGGTLRLRGYPDHMVLAEKIVTALDRGEANTRWRDFVDIAWITRARRITYSDQRTALEAVGDHRQVPLDSMRSLMAAMPEQAGGKWRRWRHRQRLEGSTPERFEDLLSECLAYAEPVLDRSADGSTWNPHTLAWEHSSSLADAREKW